MRLFGDYIFDEFAREGIGKKIKEFSGVDSKQYVSCGISCVEVYLDKHNYLNKPAGIYFTFEIEKVMDRTSKKLTSLIKSAIKKLLPNKYHSVLILGMGNSLIVSDTLGVKTIDNFDIIKFMRVKNVKVSKFEPGVFAVSGLESFDVVQAIVKQLNPDVVIVVDSLCTTNLSRLGKSFQITDAGIVPGSAMGNNLCNLSTETLGVKVISIGVPMVIYLNSVVQAVLDRIKPPNHVDLGVIYHELEQINSIFSPKDIDFLINFTAEIIAQAIFEAL